MKKRPSKRTLIRWKVYIDRARMYIGYIQFFMIGLVLLESYRDTKFGSLFFDNLLLSVPILFVIFIGFSLILGRLDTVYGLREEELRNSAESNPVMRDILAKLEKITQELEAQKKE